MKKKSIYFLLFGLFLFGLNVALFAQTALKRTTYKTENLEFGIGGTIDIIGAPTGAIRIEGWQKNEVEITAEIETEAATEEDLAILSQVNGFTIQHNFGSITITTVGAHDKRYIKKNVKDFPKRLRGTPFKIDYSIKVPLYSDLKINGGKGDFSVKNVDGAKQVNFLETNAEMILTGGAVAANFGVGTVNIIVAAPNWRGNKADFQLTNGTMNLEISPSFNGFINAKVLRTGKVENDCGFLNRKTEQNFSTVLFKPNPAAAAQHSI